MEKMTDTIITKKQFCPNCKGNEWEKNKDWDISISYYLRSLINKKDYDIWFFKCVGCNYKIKNLLDFTLGNKSKKWSTKKAIKTIKQIDKGIKKVEFKNRV